MKPPPTNPHALRTRTMDALIADIRDPKAIGFPRVEALRAVSIATRGRGEGDLG